MKERLPSLYRSKDIEKKVLDEWNKITGMSEFNARMRYIGLCKSLKTFGMTLFKVQVKIDEKKKKKLKDAVMCLNKEGILVLEYETKVMYPIK